VLAGCCRIRDGGSVHLSDEGASIVIFLENVDDSWIRGGPCTDGGDFGNGVQISLVVEEQMHHVWATVDGSINL
jgi:hypothetical protein